MRSLPGAEHPTHTPLTASFVLGRVVVELSVVTRGSEICERNHIRFGVGCGGMAALAGFAAKSRPHTAISFHAVMQIAFHNLPSPADAGHASPAALQPARCEADGQGLPRPA